MGYSEYAVLKVPGFKVLGFDEMNDGNWNRIHTGEDATSPYVNEHRWFVGITEYHVAEYIALKSKINHWKGRKQNKMFRSVKFTQYENSLNELVENYTIDTICSDLNKYNELLVFLPKDAKEMFIF